MEKARAAVADFTSRRGHDTTVDETVRPAVVKEHVKPTRHEQVQEAVDREVHQDHYHTTIQPLQHQEILPEKHVHQMKGVIEKSFDHGDDHETRLRLEREAAQFKDAQVVHETRTSSSVAPVVAGEHVHHHVHETVQPILHKEIITPEVVHTTVPIHEVHHAESKLHGTSILPMKTMQEFETGGGNLTGTTGTTAHETYEGAPRPYNKDLQLNPADAEKLTTGPGLTGSTGTHGAGPHNSKVANEVDPRVDSDMNGRDGLGRTSGTGYGTDGTTNASPANNYGSGNVGTNRGFGEVTDHDRYNDSSINGSSNNTDSTGYKKPSLLDRLNPMKDTSTRE